MLEMWLSKKRLLSNSTPRFLTVDEELTKQPSSFRPCSRLLHAEVLGPIIKGIVVVVGIYSSHTQSYQGTISSEMQGFG